jgi:putative membrane protein
MGCDIQRRLSLDSVLIMSTQQLLLSAWTWDPSVLLGCGALVLAYLLAVRFRWNKQTLLFTSGVLVLGLALESPLDMLGDTYLFSAHMAQHLLLVLVAAPLLLLGLPRPLAERMLEQPLFNKLERILGQPVLAWLIGMGFLWLWHLPSLYNAALGDEDVHILEHLCFLVTATIFWWPVLTPLSERRLAPLASIPYLFAAAVANSALGIILTFTAPGLYPTYLYPLDWLGILQLIRERWGLSPELDQQIGGLLMWVPGSLVYLSGIVGALVRWYSEPESDIGVTNALLMQNWYE